MIHHQCPGIRVTISAAGRRRLEAEQRRDRLYAEAKLLAMSGGILTLAVVTIAKLLGA